MSRYETDDIELPVGPSSRSEDVTTGTARLADRPPIARPVPRQGRRCRSGIPTGWVAIAAAGATLLLGGIHALGRIPTPTVSGRVSAVIPSSTAAPVPLVIGSNTATPEGAERTSPAPAGAPVAPPGVPPSVPPLVTAVSPPRAGAQPAVRTSGVLSVQPSGIVESLPVGSPWSPLVTFTVESTGRVAAVIGRVTTTNSAFHITRDDCSGARLAAGAMCHVTLQFQPRTPGRYSASLLVLVVGGDPKMASLQGEAR